MMPFRLDCIAVPSPGRGTYYSEWHGSVEKAVTAMTDHQQEAWDSVALVAVTENPVPLWIGKKRGLASGKSGLGRQEESR